MKAPLFLLGIFLIISCAGAGSIERYRSVMGLWRTERNIVLSVYNSPENGVAAFIKSAPGFLGEETKTDKAVITNIKSLVDGGFEGYFVMPGRQKPVKVKMVFTSPDVLVIMSWDKRVKGNIMKWERIPIK